MTPQQIQRTMDFILRSQADSVIRMQRNEEERRNWEEKRNKWEESARTENAEIRRTVKSISREIRELLKSQRNYERRIRTLQESERRIAARYEGIRDVVRILTRLTAAHSKRLDRIESSEP
jgi:predicted RNase H-like nuclease (RuvC/YqgF family)